MDESETFVEFMLEDLELLLALTPSIIINSLCEDLRFIRSFLREAQRFTNLQVSADANATSCSTQTDDNFGTHQMASLSEHPQELSLLSKQVKSVKERILRISRTTDLSKQNSGRSTMEMQVVVGITDEKRALINRLIDGPKQLKVICITEMPPDLGKLAEELFKDPLVRNHFDIWGCGYETRMFIGRPNKFFRHVEFNLPVIDDKEIWGNNLTDLLKNKRYLIVINDTWNFGVRNDIKMFFPDDYNGSRVLFIRSGKDIIRLEKEIANYRPFARMDAWIRRHISINDDFGPGEKDAYSRCYWTYYIFVKNGRDGSVTTRMHIQRTTSKKREMNVETAEDLDKRTANITRELFQSSSLYKLAAEVTYIKKEILEIYGNGFSEMNNAKEVESFSRKDKRRESSSPISGGKITVGFDDEAKSLRERLTGQVKKLEVIPIVGMAGIGKTTLAKILYNDPRIVHHFHIRGWASVSQAYQKSLFLDQILCFLAQDQESIREISDEGKEELLRKCLKGKRYLIVIDDIWDAGVWNDVEMCFPNDEKGSKVLMTTRNKDVASDRRYIGPPYFLRVRSQDESWDLFKHKVFADEGIPEELMEIGNKIVAKCKGLPLALVVVAGLLANEEKNIECWSHVFENIGSYIESDAEQYTNILALSYDYLPHSLKPCFLYLGAFPEDFEIPVKRLIYSWIAEGLIQQTEVKRVEDVAEECLMNLIDRSLVIVAKNRSDGGIKACHIHDMWRNFCIRKAQEIEFVLPNLGYESRTSSSHFKAFYFNNFSSDGFSSLTRQNPYSADLDINYVPFDWLDDKETMEFRYNPLRVLNLSCIVLDSFPDKILQLVRLKYLALRIDTMAYLPPTICKLWSLETLIIDVVKGRVIILPQSIWKMFKLRHIDITAELQFEMPKQSLAGPSTSGGHEFEHRRASGSSPSVLNNLQAISQLCPSGSVKDILARTPNVRKLGFHFTLSDGGDPFCFPELTNLYLLESLKFEYQTYGMAPVSIPPAEKFPPGLRKLTLIGSHVNWEQMSTVGALPNLEVLKLEDNFFSGTMWKASKGGFLRLKYLKFSHMDLQQWIASSCPFPMLEKLVLNGCLDLEEIPSAIGYILTLKVIEVYRSRPSVADSAWQIQEFQRELSNDELKVFIYPQFQEDFLPGSAS